jgi:hypothetical protein
MMGRLISMTSRGPGNQKENALRFLQISQSRACHHQSPGAAGETGKIKKD